MQCTDLNVRRGVDDVEIEIPIIDALGNPLVIEKTGKERALICWNNSVGIYVNIDDMSDPNACKFTISDSSAFITIPVEYQQVGSVSVSFFFDFLATVGSSTRNITEYNSNQFEIVNFYE